MNQTALTKTAWLFDVQEEQTILEGILPETKLGVLQATSNPYQVVAEFRVQRQDICLTWDRAKLSQKLSRNQLAVIEQMLILKYIGPQLEASPLSEVRWQHD